MVVVRLSLMRRATGRSEGGTRTCTRQTGTSHSRRARGSRDVVRMCLHLRVVQVEPAAHSSGSLSRAIRIENITIELDAFLMIEVRYVRHASGGPENAGVQLTDRLRIHQNKMASAASATMPPTTPPTIGPVLLDECEPLFPAMMVGVVNTVVTRVPF